ncbi:type I restriction endonuclease subunit R [Malacoplasma muris]|uniref:type I restriction endonuclease subunit R n=1 Tax=Malacoplasma muris TaxID=2119 RepID=UPI00398E4C5B
MSDRLTSEYEIETKLCNKLLELGYKDRSNDINTIEAIQKNIKYHIERLNANTSGGLDGKSLDDDKFYNLILKPFYRNSIFKNGKLIRDKIMISKDSGNQHYWFNLFDKDNLDNNIFEFSRQVKHKCSTSREGNRSDLTIFINGIPIVQIELKRDKIDIEEAFNQIGRYKKESFDIDSPFKLVQIFIISNKTRTKYFANANNIQKKFYFEWKDEENKCFGNVYDVAASMLNKETLFNLIINYMIFTVEDNNETIMILRSYQYYAVERIIKHIKDTEEQNKTIINLDERSKLNGYIWHATGSGKTLTSFKVAQLLSNNKFTNIEKSIFLVDRLDLNAQTIDSFNLFLGNENKTDDVKSVDSTDELKRQLLEPTRKIIITTMQKMNNLLTRNNREFVNKNKEFINRNFVFIVDECHRTQFGDMHKELRKAFQKSRLIGFTGTPIFPSNQKDGNTTEEIFGKCLHNYKMVDAINDRNVLPFTIEYIKGPKKKLEPGDDIESEGIEKDKEVFEIDTEGFFKSDQYINKVVDYIYQINEKKTFNRSYKSMLVCQDIESACKYYFRFREAHSDLKVAVLFSKNSNDEKISESDDGQVVYAKENLNRVLEAYNKDYDKSYNEFDFKQYSRDIQNNLKNKNNGLIDLVIVVKMLTTGFDAKPINTVYLDRSLKSYELIQTISRANRVFDLSKDKANIVSFRTFKKNVDQAISLYCDNQSLSQVFEKDTLDNLIKQANFEIEKIVSRWPTVLDIKNEMSETAKKDFVIGMKKFNKLYLVAKTFIEFQQKMIDWSIETIEEYRNIQKEIHRLTKRYNDKESVLNEIDFELEVIKVDEIDVDYILNELDKLKTITDTNVFEMNVQNIIDEIEKKGLKSKAKLIEEFIQKWKMQMINNEISESQLSEHTAKMYGEFRIEKMRNKILEFAQENNLDTTNLIEIISKKNIEQKDSILYSEEIRRNVLNDNKLGIIKQRELINKIIDFIDNIYNDDFVVNILLNDSINSN